MRHRDGGIGSEGNLTLVGILGFDGSLIGREGVRRRLGLITFPRIACISGISLIISGLPAISGFSGLLGYRLLETLIGFCEEENIIENRPRIGY